MQNPGFSPLYPMAASVMPTAPADATARFIDTLQQAFADNPGARLVLAKPRGGQADLQRVHARVVNLKGVPHLSFVHTHRTRDVTRNLTIDEAIDWVATQLANPAGAAFGHAHLQTASEDVQLLISKKGKATLLRRAVERAADAPAHVDGDPRETPAHDRAKHRWVDVHRPFLTELGVTTRDGQLVPAMARKWKQINKFVEVFSHAIDATPLARADTVRVADFGAGKGYLTFAVYDHLRETRGLQAQVTGVELRHDLVTLGNHVAIKLGLDGLRFDEGDVRCHTPGEIDVVIALHACDTATDHAIHLGVKAGSQVILCSPCCHKEVRPQLMSPHPLRPLLQHGVHRGQQAEMLTDGLRAMLLEACGYDTQVFEFVSLEHTNKNKMILAVRRASTSADRAAWLAQVAELKAFYGVRDQCLETLLRADGRLGSNSDA